MCDKKAMLSSDVKIFSWGTDGRGINLFLCGIVSLLAGLAANVYFIYSHAWSRDNVASKKS